MQQVEPVEDRAAKAARAKALLKKRQQHNVAKSVATPPRTFSPAPQEPTEDGVRDAVELFSSKDGSDTMLTSPPRIISPPLPQSNDNTASQTHVKQSVSRELINLQKKVDALSKQNETLTLESSRAAQQADVLLQDERRHLEELKTKHERLRIELENALEDERRTVSILVSEKVQLTSKLNNWEDVESKHHVLEGILESERLKCSHLDERVEQLQVELGEVSRRFQEVKTTEEERLERNKEMERKLQIAAVELAESRKAASKFQLRSRELEEQIQADDRVERLEVSLKNTQDRNDELEFQLRKVKQSNATVKLERDGLQSQLQELETSESDWKSKLSTLDHQLVATRHRLSELEAQCKRLSQENLKYEVKSKEDEDTSTETKSKLVEVSSSLAAVTRQLHHSETELKNALRRAEDAESLQQSLQAEGSRLMQSLDEIRPKIVELTDAQVNLLEKVETLESTLRIRDQSISELESNLSETRDKLDQSDDYWKSAVIQRDRQVATAEMATTDVEKAYIALPEEFDALSTNLRNLEVERSSVHQETSRHLQELERLSHLTQMQEEQLYVQKKKLEEMTVSYKEEQNFRERAQNEIEALHLELVSREEEIALHRESSKNSPNAARFFDEEMIRSQQQTHGLELSTATSKIRDLENAIFNKDSTIYDLQKRLGQLEQHPTNTNPRKATKTLIHNGALDHNHRPSLPTPLARTVFDQVISPDTFHKRNVSLNMLKARMESEARSTGQFDREASRPVANSQFLEASHIFWCHACHGDLVIL